MTANPFCGIEADTVCMSCPQTLHLRAILDVITIGAGQAGHAESSR